MLKGFMELYNLDISAHISKKPTFKYDKESGKYIKQPKELDYLSWSACLMLLHENGAETVKYGNILSPENHTLFLLDGKLPEVHVFLEVDGKRYEMAYPVIDGSSDISPEKMVQSDVHNASQRAFVKCTAINTGLGLKLWEKDDTPENPPKEDITVHNALKLLERIKTKYANAVALVGDQREVNSLLNASDRVIDRMFSALKYAYSFEKELDRIR